MSNLGIIHYPHELTLGGVAVTVSQYLYDFQALGQRPACATLVDGFVGNQLRERGIPVFVLKRPEDLVAVAREFGAHVLHGHTCGGGSAVLAAGKELGIVAGEHVHSMVPRSGPMEGQFEICQVAGLHAMRPGSTFIRWCFDPERLKVTEGREAVRRRLGIPLDAFVIGRNGRLDGAKDPQMFVRVLAKLPEVGVKDVYGILSGWGPEAAALAGLAVELGCSDRLRMPGLCASVGNILNAMDVIVYPTVDESLCAGIVEPMLLGKPVVATPVGNMGEFLIDGTTGLAVRRDTPTTLLELVNAVRSLKLFANQAKLLGERAKAHIERLGMHDSMNSARPLVQLYQTLVEARRLDQQGR